jgi:hypothetical protein
LATTQDIATSDGVREGCNLDWEWIADAGIVQRLYERRVNTKIIK